MTAPCNSLAVFCFVCSFHCIGVTFKGFFIWRYATQLWICRGYHAHSMKPLQKQADETSWNISEQYTALPLFCVIYALSLMSIFHWRSQKYFIMYAYLFCATFRLATISNYWTYKLSILWSWLHLAPWICKPIVYCVKGIKKKKKKHFLLGVGFADSLGLVAVSNDSTLRI